MGVSIGGSLLIAIIVETGGRALLLIPQAVNALIDKGKRENRERVKKVLQLYGSDHNGVRTVSFTPEIMAYINGDTDHLPPPPSSDSP